MHVLADRIETEVEVDGMHAPALLRELQQVSRLRGSHGQRLLADDVLAGAKCGARMLVMQVIG